MFGKGGSRVIHRDLEQAHLTLALEGVPQSDLSLFSLQVFSNILGGGMSSRLFQEVREKRALLLDLHIPCGFLRHRFLRLYTGPDPADAPGDDGSDRRRDEQCRRDTDRAGNLALESADEGRPADGA
jgi:hypothetical protein